MRKLLFMLLFALPVMAQQAQFMAPDCQFEFSYKVVANVITSTTSLSANRLPLSQGGGNVVGYDNRSQGCTSWTITGQTQGISAISFELDQAVIAAGDIPGSWVTWTAPAPGTVFPITATGTIQASAFGYNPWVSVNLTSATGTGTVYGRVYGWRTQAGSDVTAPGNSVVVAGFAYKHISTGTNTQIKATPGTLHTLVINTTVASTITVVDTSAANCSGGVNIAVFPASAVVGTYTYDVATVNGLCITTAGASDLTVSFR